MTVPWPDSRLIREFLRGRRSGRSSESLHWHENALVTRMGAWQLLVRDPFGMYFLSLDHPVAILDHRATELRKKVLKSAQRNKVSVLPVAWQAYFRATGDRVDTRWLITDAKTAVTVIDVNNDMESVFCTDSAYYLSGYDGQESPPLYFLCRLPCPVASVKQARQVLKPASVRAAEAAGIRVERQGDIFAFESVLTDDDLKRLGAEIFGAAAGPQRRTHHWPPTSRVPIYGTAHTSYNVAVLPSKVMLAKGALLHTPSILGQRRRPDHSDRELGDGDTWWWLTRNTVPIADPSPDDPSLDQRLWTAGTALEWLNTSINAFLHVF